MGEYSISKSFKGILRIGHIMEMIAQQKDMPYNPTYYGTPNALMNISGGTYAAKELGFPQPIKGTSGEISRYTSTNPYVGDDTLRQLRVPMTDSMGNYLNWNVGLEGVTIGSNEEINGNKIRYALSKQKLDPDKDILHFVNYPILTSQFTNVGLANKLIREQKFGATDATVTIQNSQGNSAMIIIDNYYDKTQANMTRVNLDTPENKAEDISPTELFQEKNMKWYKYKDITKKDDSGNTVPRYKKLRTIYKDTKNTVENYDVMMYHQEDWDKENWQGVTPPNRNNAWNNNTEMFPDYEKGDVLDCHADIINLKEYVKRMIQKYMNGNVVEVPSGTVIWQYCSLDKWYCSPIDSASAEMNTGGYAGNRPAMGVRQDDDTEPFFSTLIQGACRKMNHIKNETDSAPKEEKEDDSMMLNSQGLMLDEVIPLYKRDYVLCDGTKYRIPYRPEFEHDVTNQREVFERFKYLLFSIGYKYTKREQLAQRMAFTFDAKTQYCYPRGISLISTDTLEDKYEGMDISKVEDVFLDDGTKKLMKNILLDAMTGKTEAFTFENIEKVKPSPGSKKYRETTDTITTNGWSTCTPYLQTIDYKKTTDKYNKLDDVDVLFQVDWATMIACDMLYKEFKNTCFDFKTNTDQDKWANLSREERKELIQYWIRTKSSKFDERYIINTFIGDNKYTMQEMAARSGMTTAPEVMGIPYYNYREYTGDSSIEKTPVIYIGRQVNSLNSYIKLYNPTTGNYVITQVYKLPCVQLFILLLASSHKTDDTINKFCFVFFNNNFQVPNLCQWDDNDKSPVFIGSSGMEWADSQHKKIREVQSWSSEYTRGTTPHRHALFYSHMGTAGAFNSEPYASFSGGSRDSVPPSGSVYINGLDNNNRTRTEKSLNYIVNEINCDSSQSFVRNGISYSVFQLDDKGDGWKTGPYRQGEPVDFKYNANQGDNILAYLNRHKGEGFFSFSLIDDPRFENAEPNRGITSPIHRTFQYDNVIHVKLNSNTSNFGGDGNWFSPENIKMLPLIKI